MSNTPPAFLSTPFACWVGMYVCTGLLVATLYRDALARSLLVVKGLSREVMNS